VNLIFMFISLDSKLFARIPFWTRESMSFAQEQFEIPFEQGYETFQLVAVPIGAL
jgi:hypothetical protein